MGSVIAVPGPGANVSRLRKERGWGQARLAAAAGVSTSQLGKIERGERTLTQGVAASLARAMSLSLEEVLGTTPVPLDAAGSVRALNSAVRRFDLPREPEMTEDEIAAALASMGEARNSADLDQVLVDLPRLVAGAQDHAHAMGTPEACALVVEAYSTVYWLAARHRWMTLADLAVTKQKLAAQQSDPVTAALAARDEAGVYLNHGEFDDGLAVVDRAITQAEGSTTGPGRSYALGILHLRGLTLAGRLQDKRTADQHITRAWAMAEGFTEDVERCGIQFGPENTAVHVIATSGDLRRHADAISTMEDLVRDGTSLPATRTSPLHMNTARSRLALGDREGALADLEQAWALAPQMAKVHPTSQEVLRVLTSAHKRSNPRIVKLAKKAHIQF
ncbi:putative transcriptional regulator [Actinacidiphila reveromycinica]|uniref:Putative transcriptional regulator n=2 Tax=Actinacidiphila reveromycinica TaxID=659352 RepID=A0A7U3VPR8_9ACTN|nr:helix-turn-helix transcriptional regulator [Streptomyces sp. SN-593]BBA99042.1 putative transcriptional regulator [Streptomyces sp. SN-593]